MTNMVDIISIYRHLTDFIFLDTHKLFPIFLGARKGHVVSLINKQKWCHFWDKSEKSSTFNSSLPFLKPAVETVGPQEVIVHRFSNLQV